MSDTEAPTAPPNAWKQTVRDIFDELHFGPDSVFVGQQRLATCIIGMIEARHAGYFGVGRERSDADALPALDTQPMATAPQDGTYVILLSGMVPTLAREARWGTCSRWGAIGWAPWNYEADGSDQIEDAWGWLPLPERGP